MAHQGVSQSIIRRCLFVHFRNVPAVIVCVFLKIQHNLHRRGLTLCSLSPPPVQVHCLCPENPSQFYQFLPAAHIECHSLATIISY